MSLNCFLVAQVKFICLYNLISILFSPAFFSSALFLLFCFRVWLIAGSNSVLPLWEWVSLNALLRKHSQFNLLASTHWIAMHSSRPTFLCSIGPSPVVLICLMSAVQWYSTIGYVPVTENSSHGSVNVISKASSCAPLCGICTLVDIRPDEQGAAPESGIICCCPE